MRLRNSSDSSNWGRRNDRLCRKLAKGFGSRRCSTRSEIFSGLSRTRISSCHRQKARISKYEIRNNFRRIKGSNSQSAWGADSFRSLPSLKFEFVGKPGLARGGELRYGELRISEFEFE